MFFFVIQLSYAGLVIIYYKRIFMCKTISWQLLSNFKVVVEEGR